ncbi:tyrosine-type recombinase/integrase [Rhodopirellula sallentina]|uniref:Integrase/recombinase n=1 Tax=Rhodopirellula sallentina SM41 TaxID=1263870 RepID=M5UBZ8_9BACT|nr:site-specific integrase [Rhodopirellula sallentina]EMI53528.1 integrase/recombinase [Rhodopirellula sallentina SM41]
MVAKQQSKKPEKPRPDFPLYAHARGYWCKSFGGKKYNCGPWGDPAAAERNWLEIKARLERGEPAHLPESITVKVMCNRYQKEQNRRASMGDVSPAHAREVRGYCVYLLKHFGARREIATIRKEDFAAIKASFPEAWTLRSRRNHILGIRSIFKWAWQNDLLSEPPKYGQLFSVPTKRAMRNEKADKPKKLFSADQIWSLLQEARPQMHAMIWLGLNAAYGNDDCSELRESWIDWDECWLSRPRGKTGKDRAAWLWPETIAAIRAVLDGQSHAFKNRTAGDHVFLTRTGKLWVDRNGTNRDSIGEQFRLLARTVGCYQKNVGFYSLRHTFATIASGCGDQIAVDHVMGHLDSGMSAHYREFIERERVVKACDHVRMWILSERPEAGL